MRINRLFMKMSIICVIRRVRRTFFFFFSFLAISVAYESPQARDRFQVGAVAYATVVATSAP